MSDQDTARKGQGGVLKMLIAILIVAILSAFLFLNLASTTGENIQDLSITFTAYDSQARQQTLYQDAYVVTQGKNPSIITAVAYGCSYGRDTEGFEYFTSDKVLIVFKPEQYIERYFNQTISGNYYFEMDCPRENEKDKTLKAGKQPPEDAENMLVTSMEIPLPRKDTVDGQEEPTTTKAFLYRWR